MRTCPECHGEGKLPDPAVAAIERRAARRRSVRDWTRRWGSRVLTGVGIVAITPGLVSALYGLAWFVSWLTGAALRESSAERVMASDGFYYQRAGVGGPTMLVGLLVGVGLIGGLILSGVLVVALVDQAAKREERRS